MLSRKLVCPSQHRTDDIASPKEVATFTILIRVVAVVVVDLVDAFSQQEGEGGISSQEIKKKKSETA